MALDSVAYEESEAGVPGGSASLDTLPDHLYIPRLRELISYPRSHWSPAIPVRLLIADDHEIVRMGVRILLSDQDQWEICGEAKDGAEALELVLELSPDVVVLDLSMPVMGGFDTAKRIRRLSPATRIVFFSIHETPTTARLVGADAFVSKSSAAKDLAQTIRRVVANAATPPTSATPLVD